MSTFGIERGCATERDNEDRTLACYFCRGHRRYGSRFCETPSCRAMADTDSGYTRLLLRLLSRRSSCPTTNSTI
jgi:hypothetical protein